MENEPLFDLDEALARVDQDEDILRTMAELFADQGPKDLAAAQTALATQDASGLARAAHRLKGAVLQFCAPSVLELTKQLEALGKAGDVGSAVEVYTRLEPQLLRLCMALRDFASSGERQ